MDEPLTEKLLEELLDAPSEAAAASFTRDHQLAESRSLSEYLGELLEAKFLKRSKVVREAQINSTYGHQIFTGERMPSRDYVLRLAFAMSCNLRETNRLLQAAGKNQLYPKNRRDAIIIWAIEHGKTLQETDAILYQYDQDTITE